MPRSWLKPTQNLVVLFEELGGDPTRISLVKRTVSSVCADITEYHPTIKNWHIESYGRSEEFHKPKVHLHCAPGQSISSIKFASFGTAMGTCGSFQQGTCHAPTSYTTMERVLLIFFVFFPFFHYKSLYPLINCMAPISCLIFAEVPRATKMLCDHFE